MYAELVSKTNFSFLEGGSHPHELIERAAAMDLSAIAITDHQGVYGLPKAYWEAKNHPKLRLISGCEIDLVGHPPVVILASTKAGYGWMCRLLTQAHADQEKGQGSLTLAQLRTAMEDARSQETVFLLPLEANHAWFREMHSRCYLTLSRWKDGLDGKRTLQALKLEEQQGMPLVATNRVLYHAPGRKKLQDALTCIRHGTNLLEAGFRLQSNAERYLKSPFEMKLLFRDLPRAIDNTLKIAEACSFQLSELRYRYPSEWIPSGHTAQSYLEEQVWLGAKGRYPKEIPGEVRSQIHHELQLIQKLHFADYFLTIFDIVQFAKERKILCQGRGSAANSVVCYCLGITAIDPVRMKLLFERFISEERGEPPDIDVDFEHERREEVIRYIYEKYGRDRAAMVSAVITYQKRSALRELAKVFAIEVGTRSAKELMNQWSTLVQQSPIPGCSEAIDVLSDELQTFPRHLSIHSGGFTLSADPMVEIVPVEPARMEGRTIIQWDKYDLDYLGLLKIDVLSLGMLSAIRKTLDHLGMRFEDVPKEDPATYKMIQKADTVGTFQVESRAQMNMSGRLMPRSFYDLVVQVAIVRPGPIVGQMVHPYLKRRRGLEKVEYPHPKLREILGRTLGVPLFQEQLMKIAIELGQFSPGEADQLRRAIGAWRASGSIRKVADKLFRRLCLQGIPQEYALNILEHMKGFAHYGFPESHAASFALITYVSCYLKRHHPAAFACGLLNSQPMGFYAPHSLIDDAKRHGVGVLPIDLNHSMWDCTLEQGQLRLGLRLVQGLHRKEADRLMTLRPFESLEALMQETRIRASVLERIAMAGGFSGFEAEERRVLWRILAQQVIESSDQLSLFRSTPGYDGRSFAPTSEYDRIRGQYQAYGVGIDGHPMQALRKIQRLPKMTTQDVKRQPAKTKIQTSGLLLVRQKPPTANGVCFSAIEDEHGILDLILFHDTYERYKEVFLHHCFFVVGGLVERDGHSVSVIVKRLSPLLMKGTNEVTDDLVIEPDQYFF